MGKTPIGFGVERDHMVACRGFVCQMLFACCVLYTHYGQIMLFSCDKLFVVEIILAYPDAHRFLHPIVVAIVVDGLRKV